MLTSESLMRNSKILLCLTILAAMLRDITLLASHSVLARFSSQWESWNHCTNSPYEMFLVMLLHKGFTNELDHLTNLMPLNCFHYILVIQTILVNLFGCVKCVGFLKG